jgi:hypothetical protein
MEHVGIVVDDLAAATEFFVELGLELQGEGPVEGRWVDRVVGLEGVRAQIAMLQTPDSHGRIELTKFHTPSTEGGDRHTPAKTPTPSLEACEPRALNSWASWGATRTNTGSARSVALRTRFKPCKRSDGRET